MSAVLLSLAPLALLVGTLLLGRYPGERTLTRARAAVRRPPRRAARRPPVRPPRRPWAAAPRGGCLVAAAVASRPPPLPST
jgi:hypothetical protein